MDVQLVAGPTGLDLGRRLTEKGIPYIFVSGNLKRIPKTSVEPSGHSGSRTQ